MYSEQVISDLTERIGWGLPQETDFGIEISESNSVGTSQREFKDFHQLVTVENIYAAVTQASEEENAFNEILEETRKKAVLAVLPLILDKNESYLPLTDYSAAITENIVLFDDAIGYKVAMMMIELFISTGRLNFLERNAKLATANLKVELNGIRSENGQLFAEGLVHLFQSSIKSASSKIFPKTIIVQSIDNAW
jgi:hypothetical protein